MNLYELHFDGSCWPNPGGTAAFGYHLSLNGQEVDFGHGVIGTGETMSNNVAEYWSLNEGLKAVLNHAKNLNHIYLKVRGDSQLVINQMDRNGGKRPWRAHPEKLYYKAYLRAIELTSGILSHGGTIVYEWIPRELNTVCDELSKRHLDTSFTDPVTN